MHNFSIFLLETCNDDRATSSLLGNRYRDTGAVATVASDELSSDDASSFQSLLDLWKDDAGLRESCALHGTCAQHGPEVLMSAAISSSFILRRLSIGSTLTWRNSN